MVNMTQEQMHKPQFGISVMIEEKNKNSSELVQYPGSSISIDPAGTLILHRNSSQTVLSREKYTYEVVDMGKFTHYGKTIYNKTRLTGHKFQLIIETATSIYFLTPASQDQNLVNFIAQLTGQPEVNSISIEHWSIFFFQVVSVGIAFIALGVLPKLANFINSMVPSIANIVNTLLVLCLLASVLPYLLGGRYLEGKSKEKVRYNATHYNFKLDSVLANFVKM